MLNSHIPVSLTGGSGGSQSPRAGHSGRLIVFEGVDGVGKSTQIELLTQRLKEKGHQVVVTTWNSSRLVSKAIKRAKKARLLTPCLYSTLHASDFMYRLEHIILPSLEEGAIVIADRYAYTALARDLARAVDRGWVESLYALAPAPDLGFYCTAPVEESLGRIIDRNGGTSPGYYESGMDVTALQDPGLSFREFQTRVASEYDRIRVEAGLLEIDSTGSIADIHAYVSSIVEARLNEWNGAQPSATPPAVARSGNVTDELLAMAASGPGQGHGFPGRLVVIESADKRAAARQANLLYNELLAQGYDARLALMGESWVGIEVARKALMKTIVSLPTKVFLSAAEIALYYESLILPALRSGAVVVMDGYLAGLFTSAVASGLNAEWFAPMFRMFRIKPDRTVLLDVPLRDVMRKKSLRPSSDMFSYATDEAGSDVSVQSKIIELYRTLAGAGKWTVTSSAGTEKEPQKQILAGLTAAVLPGVPRRTEGELLGEPLREVFDLFSHYDREFDHPRKVAELACSLFDQTVDLHEYGGRERALLFYAAMLHDIGHALSETRHEEFTFDAIMRHQFVTVSDHDRDLVANIAFLHRQPLARLNFRHMNRMNEADRLRVKRLAALLRIADALDDSGKRVVQEVRCYPEHGAVCVDLRSVSKALPERAEALRKADLFEEVYRRSVVVGRNRIEKLARDRRRLEPEGVAPSGS